MLGILHVLVFLIPVMCVAAFWPGSTDPKWWKVIALVACGLSGTVLYIQYMYLSCRLTLLAERSHNGPEERSK